MNSRDRDPHSSSLTVKLMAVAAEHELQVKREKQRLEAKLAELASSNEEYERRHRQQAYQIESLTRKLEEAVAEVQRFSVTQVGGRPYARGCHPCVPPGGNCRGNPCRYLRIRTTPTWPARAPAAVAGGAHGGLALRTDRCQV